MSKPKNYCPFTHVLEHEHSRTSAIVLANTALAVDTYAEMKAALRKHDALLGSSFARYTEPDCEVFEQARGKWIPMRHLQELATTFLRKVLP